MSYRARIGPQFAAARGIEPDNSCVICDGCGLALLVIAPNGMPYRWFTDRYMAGKPAPGWWGERTEGPDGIKRRDLCGKCRTDKKEAKERE
jgi:hypothetical protein